MSRFAAAAPPIAVALLAAAVFFTGIDWGLPNRNADRFLFGSHPVWTGQQIIALAGDWDDAANRGADIAMHPLAGRDKPIVVNATDAERAAIVRRYRLYSDQPDEMITFRALSRMKPAHGDLDPHFFQYGGLWVYPVGALIKAASLLHLLTLRSDLAFYLDHPESFARLYIVARAYSAAWGVLGVLVVYALMMQWTASRFAAVVGSLLYATMPVVVNAAHEAKPHLPGAVLTLATVLAAMRFVRSGKRRWALLAGAGAGAAMAMVLTGVVAFAVLPVMPLLRPMSWARRIGLAATAAGGGLLLFAIANPYLPIDYLFHREIVQSNVGNYGNFYRPALSAAAVANAGKLLWLGMSTLPALAAAIALPWLVLQSARRPGTSRPRGWDAPGLGWLLAAPAAVAALQFVLLALAKPAEYARFALFLDVALALCVAVCASRRLAWRWALAPVLLWSVIAGAAYVAAFSGCHPMLKGLTRRGVAEFIDSADRKDAPLLTWAEPAPYCLPPVDLFTHRIYLMPRSSTATDPDQQSALAISPIESISTIHTIPNPWLLSLDWAIATPISWAGKPFDVHWVPARRPYNRQH